MLIHVVRPKRALSCFFFLFFSIISYVSSAQSETHDFITYDTILVDGSFQWNARVSRPVNMFTPNHPDTASRPVIISMPGSGEHGTNMSQLQLYGPHHWLNNGWDGSVVLGNGTHYPILITVMRRTYQGNDWDTEPRGPQIHNMMNILFNRFHIKRNSVHVAGLSMGGFAWGKYIVYEASAGARTGMRNLTSYTALQGVSNIAHAPYDAWDLGWNAFGTWAQEFGGKFFGLEGTGDTRQVWQVSENMNAAVPGSAYFAFENINNGTHCCWNTMYDPSRRNWKNQLGNLGTNIVWNTQHNNTMGTYVNGWNIFEWMLRQGDTTLVGGTPPPLVANAGNDQIITLPVSSATLNGTGSTGVITSYSWTNISGPATPTINNSTSATATAIGLQEGTYVFRLTIGDGTTTQNDDIEVEVLPASGSPSETHDFITYDTIYSDGVVTWNIRISRPANMFTANHIDTASRPALINMQGLGETGTDTSLLDTYGHHYWLRNGWDGGILLANGMHYPIIITVMPRIVVNTGATYTNPRGPQLTNLMNHLLNSYRIKRNSVHISGLSMGGTSWSKLIVYEASAGAETGMKLVTSFVCLQGASNETFAPYNAWSRGWGAFGQWAKKYDGRYFGLEGTNDNRVVYLPRNAMRDSGFVSQAYFSFETYGPGANPPCAVGGHGAWNTMYDPANRDWQCVSPVTNPNIGFNGTTGKDNTMGNYVKGWNIFEWQLRQGDTTLVGGSGSRVMQTQKPVTVIQPQVKQDHVEVFPNPSPAEITLAVSGINNGTLKVSIINTTGVVVQNYQFEKKGQVFTRSLNTSRLPGGVYFLKTEINNNTVVTRFVKL